MGSLKSFYDIYDKYPLLFPKNCIKCELGWIDIIDQMCSTIQVYLDNHIDGVDLEFEFEKIEETFGVLETSVRGGDEITEIIVKSCRKISYVTCEFCGKQQSELYCSSKHKQWSYYKTLCLEHAIELFYYRLYK